MFEQELYKYEDSQATAEPGDLFYRYEIKPWVFGPRLYKILAVSAIFNLLVVAVFTQGNLLMRRGCDSPFVGRVCEVLDTVYVATAMFGAEREYVDAAYEKTELADADITYIDVSNVDPPLSYPEGYFQIANPEQFGVQQAATDTASSFNNSFPGFSSNPTVNNPLINTPQVLPKSNPKPVTGGVPNDSPFSIGGENPTIAGTRKGRGGRVKPPLDANVNSTAKSDTNANESNPTLDPNATAANPADAPKEDQNGVFINKRPLKDKATETLAQLDAGSVKLDKTFRVVITGTLGLGKDGKTIILKDPVVAPADKNFPSDPALTKLAQEWVVAVGDAGWYGYLGLSDPKKGVGRKVAITIEQNDTTFLANLKAEQPSPERANTMSAVLGAVLLGGRMAAKGDEQTFLKFTKAFADGNFVVLSFDMAKPDVQEMIQRKLAETKDFKTQPNSTAVTEPQNNSAAK